MFPQCLLERATTSCCASVLRARQEIAAVICTWPANHMVEPLITDRNKFIDYFPSHHLALPFSRKAARCCQPYSLDIFGTQFLALMSSRGDSWPAAS